MVSTHVPDQPDLVLTVQEAVGVRSRTVCVGGEVDVLTAATLLTFIEAALTATTVALVIDVSAVTFLDSSGVRALVQAGRAAAAVGLTLSVLCPLGNTAVLRVFQLLQLAAAMTIIDRHPGPEEPLA